MSNQIFHFSNTGISSGQRFYLKDNVSGIFVRNLNIDSNFSVVASNLVYNTDEQFVSGLKKFDTRPTVNGTGVLLSGEAASLPETIVYTTGDQSVSGTKTFANNLEVQGTGIFNALDLSNISDFSFSGVTINLINSTVQSSGQIYISGNPVLTGANLSSYATITNLASTGSTLDTKINSLSGSSVLLYGDQTISGVKTFATGVSVSGNLQVSNTGIFNAVDLNNIDVLSVSGVDISITSGNVVLTNPINAPNLVYNTGDQIIGGIKTLTNTFNVNNNKIINAVPELVNVTSNFFISGNSNSRMILANNSSEITGMIVSGNAIGFNTSIVQIGAGKIQITGSGVGIVINSYNNQYKTAGEFATISILNTGNNRYIMYGNTAL